MEAIVGNIRQRHSRQRENRGVSIALAASTALAALPLAFLLFVKVWQGPRVGAWRLVWSTSIVLEFVVVELLLGAVAAQRHRATVRRGFAAWYAGVCVCWITTRLTVHAVSPSMIEAGFPIAWLRYRPWPDGDNFAPAAQLEGLVANAMIWALACIVVAFALRWRLCLLYSGSRELLAVWRCAALLLTTAGFFFLVGAFD